jgi:hypothetical protein
MSGNVTDATNVACALLIVVYAWGRFNTPPSNRSSTRRALYWSSCAGYILTALTLFAVLSILLQLPALRAALFGDADKPSLPAPLIATLGMTTLLPSVPLLKRLDSWILTAFLDWGEIPAEVLRRAATMTAQSFNVTGDDVVRLRQTYGDETYGDTLAEHLRVSGPGGLELSEYRFTRVVKLFDGIQSLARLPRYARFFAERLTQNDFAMKNRIVSGHRRRMSAPARRDDKDCKYGLRDFSG